MNKPEKIFLIEDSLRWYKLPINRFFPGSKVKLNRKNFSFDDNVYYATILGYQTRVQDFIQQLKDEGYTHQELYLVELDDGTKTVLWPEEIECSQEE